MTAAVMARPADVVEGDRRADIPVAKLNGERGRSEQHVALVLRIRLLHGQLQVAVNHRFELCSYVRQRVGLYCEVQVNTERLPLLPDLLRIASDFPFI